MSFSSLSLSADFFLLTPSLICLYLLLCFAVPLGRRGISGRGGGVFGSEEASGGALLHVHVRPSCQETHTQKRDRE